jgi:predicted DNA-binding protein (MmcQ/YjbR family)
MNIEQVREYTLSLLGVTEDQPFGDDIITFRLEGNKKHWSDVYYEQLDDSQVMEWIKESYHLVASKLPKNVRQKYK